jgi:hypothetical protein
MRRFLPLLSLSLLASMACCFCLRDSARPRNNDELQVFAAPAISLPALESESSAYFSKQNIARDYGREEILRFRSDGSTAHLFYGKNDILQKIQAYRLEHEELRLAYEAHYDAQGRRVLRSSSFASDGSLESKLERSSDGTETRCYFKKGTLSKRVELSSDGRQSSQVYEDGVVRQSELSAPPALTQELLYWDAAQKQLRLRVHLNGSELKSWEYFKRDGQLAHSATTLADRSLEFRYFEKGQLRRRQTGQFIGEDWERAYYALSNSVLYAEGGKTIEHSISLRANGHLLKHERFNAKTGVREMRRDFDNEGRVARIEEFDAEGQSKQVVDFPASSPRSRGFVPDGMRAYPGEEEKNESIYQLDGVPFQHSVLQRQSWSMFRTPQLK